MVEDLMKFAVEAADRSQGCFLVLVSSYLTQQGAFLVEDCRASGF
jgi:hypothetical protein